MKLVAKHFEEASTALSQHQETVRIKKLLYCVCTSYWENKSNILDSFSFKVILEELRQIHSTIESLRGALYDVTGTLNRSKFYSRLADDILVICSQLYDGQLPASVKKLTEPPMFGAPSPERGQFEGVVARLSRHKQSARIKKFLYLASKGRWQTDTSVLERYSFQELLQELVQTHPNRQALKSALKTFISEINKPGLYAQIASLLYNEVKGFYGSSSNEDTEFPTKQHFPNRTTTGFTPEADSGARTSEPDSLKTRPSTQAFETLVNYDELELEPNLMSVPSTSGHRAQPSPPDWSKVPVQYDPFQIRQEMMQYGNPLKIKMLLFSAVYHPFDTNSQSDWSGLQSLTLDDLLAHLFCRYSDPISIQTKLSETARLSSDPSGNQQLAGALVQLVKPLLS
ncbi:MAG: hypothetical protein AAGG02_07885 [Cyanobacteria bacterium P01_H01_bin.15]